jgi:hypothetical protein
VTVIDLIIAVREVLRDTGRGEAIATRRHSDDEIVRALNYACPKLVQALIAKKAWLAVNKLVSTTPTADPIPANFWMLIAGLDAAPNANTYIPAYHPQIARALTGRGHDVIAVVDGAFYGNATTAIYWRKPEEFSLLDAGVLTDFKLPFYNTLRLLAAQEIIAREKKDSLRRAQHIMKLAQQKVRVIS